MNRFSSVPKSYISLIFWITGLLSVGGLIGSVTRAQIPLWYNNLQKSPLTPPDFVFGIVWTILYLMMAIGGSRLSLKRHDANAKQVIMLFAIQMMMNWAWSFLFFQFHLIAFSFFWIVGMVVCVALLLKHLKSFDKVSFYLLLPYFVWICFASYLNGTIWFLN